MGYPNADDVIDYVTGGLWTREHEPVLKPKQPEQCGNNVHIWAYRNVIHRSNAQITGLVCLFNSMFGPAWKEVNIKVLHYRSFVDRWAVFFPHKWSLMLKAFPCHDVVIKHSLVLSGCQISGIKGNNKISIIYFSDLCPAQFTFLSETGQCYLVSQKQAFNWSEADQECKTRGASLIALETEEKWEMIKNWYANSKYNVTMCIEYPTGFA